MEVELAREPEDWLRILELTEARRSKRPFTPAPVAAVADSPVLEIYLPLVERAAQGRFVVAHLGQSLDGRIATANGASRYVTGAADIEHNHRMRALFDAVVVGAGTVYHDDPRLTVRHVAGEHPTRVVLDTERSLGEGYHLFVGPEAPTLLLCAEDRADGAAEHGRAEVVGVRRSREFGGLDPFAVLDCLERRGLAAVFIEGGGVTVSRFLAAGALNRLQITVSPLILGSGKSGINLAEIDHPSRGLRPPVRRFTLSDDVLFECILDD
ncbi:MAG: RibD family protein [Alphaproteobacteria bacterium]